MEHRYSRRKRIKTEAIILRGDNIFARGRCIDIGLEGMKIHVTQFLHAKHTVEKNSLLELEFHLPLSRNPVPFREPVFVVYSSAEEIGLMFTQYNSELHLTLRKNLYGTPFPHENEPNILPLDRKYTAMICQALLTN